MRKLEWQDYAEWAAKLAVVALALVAGFAWIDRFQWGPAAQALFWPTYATLVYWILIREIHFARKPRTTKPTGSLIVRFPLQGHGYGTTQERDAIHQFTDTLESLLAASGAGDFDGDEFGNGECALFMVGDNPDAMYQAVESALRQAGFLRRGRIEFRLPGSAQPAKTIDL